MKIDILTLFPAMFVPILNESIIKAAQTKGLVDIEIYNLRDWATDKHGTVDDSPYGGGAGMILKVDVIDRAISDLKSQNKKIKSQTNVILLTPKGKRFTQQIAYKIAEIEHLILVCGHYGGYDHRIRTLVDSQISLGDFVLTGGEIPAMALVDAVVRLIPEVINPLSLKDETHSKNRKKQYPQYTRPENYLPISKGSKILSVPDVLLSGNHANIEKWRQENIK